MSDIEVLRDAIAVMHGCDSSHLSTEPVTELFEGEIAWTGDVEVFELMNHAKASKCYAWSYLDDSGETQYTTVLEIPPVISPETAVKAALLNAAKE